MQAPSHCEILSSNTNTSAKRVALSAVVVALVVMGITVGVFWPDLAFWLELRAPTVVDGIEYSLVAEKRTYLVGEPFRFSLRARNVSDTTKTLPASLNDWYEIERFGAADRLDAGWSLRVGRAPTVSSIAPGGTKILQLSAATKWRASRGCQNVGISLWQYSYFGPNSGDPLWSTVPIRIRCIQQPLRFPPETPGRVKLAMAELYDSAPVAKSESVGDTQIDYNDPMHKVGALGVEVVEALLANLQNYRLQPVVLQLLGDLQATAAVPQLIELLSMDGGDVDRFHETLVLATLARITQHPEGSRFRRRASELRVRKAAAVAYEEWWNTFRALTESAASS